MGKPETWVGVLGPHLNFAFKYSRNVSQTLLTAGRKIIQSKDLRSHSSLIFGPIQKLG